MNKLLGRMQAKDKLDDELSVKAAKWEMKRLLESEPNCFLEISLPSFGVPVIYEETPYPHVSKELV